MLEIRTAGNRNGWESKLKDSPFNESKTPKGIFRTRQNIV